MDFSNITQFRLKIEDISKHTPNSKFSIQSINLDTVEHYKSDIELIIKYHHEDLIWDGIPSYDDILERLKFGSKLNIWLKNETPIGWNWYHTKYITLNWKTPFEELRENELYGGSAFLTTKARKFPSPALLFYTMGMKKMLSEENKDTLYLYVDNWNTASIKLCLKSGMKVYKFISE